MKAPKDSQRTRDAECGQRFWVRGGFEKTCLIV